MKTNNNEDTFSLHISKGMTGYTDNIIVIILASIPVFVMDECLKHLDNLIYVVFSILILFLIVCYLYIAKNERKAKYNIEQLKSKISDDKRINSLLNYEIEKSSYDLLRYESYNKYVKIAGFMVILLFILVKSFIL